MQKNYNENLVAGAAIRDDKGRRISKLFEAPHPKMTVGYAKNLIMPNDPTEQEFNFRQAGGGVIEDGVAVIDKVKGNSVVWNQIIAKPYTFGGNRNFTFTSWFNGGSCSINDKGQFVFITNGKATGVGNALSITPKNTHKYLLSYKVKADIASVCTIYKSQSSGVIANIAEADKWYFVSYIGNNTDTNEYSSYLNAVVAANSPETTVIIDDAKVTDLTQMFGAGNEPSTYEEFLSRKPKVADEFAYNEGTIVNNKVEKVVTTGRNLCHYLEQGTLNIYNGSEQPNTTRVRTPFIPISNKHSYCTMLNKWAIRNGCFYDRNKNFISSGYPSVSTGVLDSSNIPANAAFCRLIYSAQNGTDAVTPSYDVFMFAIGDTTIPTAKYEPYEEHSLDLSWIKDIKDDEGVKLFEDGMKSAGTAFDEVGKNKVVKRFGVKMFDGTESFTDYLVDYGSFAIMRDAFVGVGSSIGISNRYVVSRLWESDPDRTKYDKQIYIDSINNRVWIRDSAFADVDSLKQYLAELYAAGTPLVVYYELAEPIEVEYDEKSLTYPVVAGGTEEAIASESSSAFRADIGYGIDAVKTILDLKARVEALEGK